MQIGARHTHRSHAVATLVLVAGLVLIGTARRRTAEAYRTATSGPDAFALPPPSVLPAVSLGYRSALADLLFSQTLVEYGIHGAEHRRFEFVSRYLESIFALDPEFCHAYRYADTFLIFQTAGNPTEDDVRTARRLIEMGFANCPNDGSLWLSGGQFLAFLATQFLSDEAEKKGFREAGARALAHAAEFSSDKDGASWKSLSAAGILSREGKRDAAIAFLERAYAATDSDDLRQDILRRLAGLEAEKAGEAIRKRTEEFQVAWRKDLPFVSRTRMLVLGPLTSPARCSGRRAARNSDRDCAGSWAEWGASHNDE